MGLIARNPCEHVRSPKPERRPLTLWTEAQMRTFLEVARPYSLYPLFVVSAATGLRLGEVLSLKWEDVDLERRRLYVVRRRKTAHSVRQVDLSDQVCSILRDRAKNGTLVFHCSGFYVYHAFQRIAKKANLPRIRFHDLRHWQGTVLFAHGVNPKVVQERLGHHSAAFTLDVYGHILPGMQKDAVSVMERVLH